MLDKNKPKNRKTWVGFYPRVTPTRAEKLKKAQRREKQKGWAER